METVSYIQAFKCGVTFLGGLKKVHSLLYTLQTVNHVTESNPGWLPGGYLEKQAKWFEIPFNLAVQITRDVTQKSMQQQQKEAPRKQPGKPPSLFIIKESETHTKKTTFLDNPRGYLGVTFCDMINGLQCRYIFFKSIYLRLVFENFVCCSDTLLPVL